MMKLEFMEEFSGSSDQMIIKGKRAKRQRPSSSTSSTADFHHSSPTTSSTTTEEDEDMAHCLILLARGYSPPQIKTAVAAAEAEDKFTTAGKLGIYVYECKTCDRTFPSFQALGGHRASHKRPKTATDDDPPPPEKQSDEEGQFRPSPPVINRICHNEQNKSSKIHECSICGSEFGSGQALGGHMRRHRATNIANARICDKIDTTTSSHEKPRSMLTFDLNLPAPPEDQFPAKQQPRLVFSAAALVDCHY